MQSLLYVKGSDGTANASVATVQTLRNAGASIILVNTVAGIPAKFYGSMGTPHTFTDPITSEVITVISDATAVDFAGHVNAGTLVIDAIAPGYTDNGSKVGDIIIVRPVTEWANNIFNVLNQSLNDDGSFKTGSIVSNAPFASVVDPVLRASELAYNCITSGGILAGLGYGSTLTASLSAGICYINGNRQIIAAVATRTYTASKDTYVDALYNSSGTATIVYTEVTNNTASPALAANSIRLGTVVSGANIAASTSIGQGGFLNTVPVISSQIFRGFDYLGNIVYPKAPSAGDIVKSKFSVYSSSAQNSVNGVALVNLDGKTFDTGNDFNTTTHLFVARTAGVHHFDFSVSSNGVTSGAQWQGFLEKNSATTVKYGSNASVVNFAQSVGGGLVQLAVGDTIGLKVSAAAVNGIQALASTTFLDGYLVSGS